MFFLQSIDNLIFHIKFEYIIKTVYLLNGMYANMHQKIYNILGLAE